MLLEPTGSYGYAELLKIRLQDEYPQLWDTLGLIHFSKLIWQINITTNKELRSTESQSHDAVPRTLATGDEEAMTQFPLDHPQQ